MSRSKKAVNKFEEGYNCAQSVLYSFAETLNMTEDFALKLANGFGAGMARKQEVCGALSGGILVINCFYGRGKKDDKSKQEKNYAKVRELIDMFEERHGSCNCKKLLDDCDLSSAEGQESFQKDNLIENCYGYVKDVVEILEKIIK